MKQKIKITLVDRENDCVSFEVDGKVIAKVDNDKNNEGKFRGSFGVYGVCNNAVLPEAIEFITGCIERHFIEFNIGVEFI